MRTVCYQPNGAISYIYRPSSSTRIKGGRSKGKTEESKKRDCNALIAAKNEIAVEHKKAKIVYGIKSVSNGTMFHIIKQVKEKRAYHKISILK